MQEVKASISLACEFLAAVLRILSRTFARTCVVRIFMCRELVANWSRTCDVRASVANLSPRNFGEFTMRNFRDIRTNVVRVSYDGRATVLRKHANTSRLSGKKIKLSDIRANVMGHSHERDCRSNKNENKLHSWGSRETLSRMSRDCRATDSRATIA